MSAFFRISAVVVLLWVGAESARAEAPMGGIEGFYGGLLRPILVPAHALGLLALGLFIGQQDSRDRRAPRGSF